MILHRALVKEVLQTFSVVATVLFSIFLVTRLLDFLSEVADGDISMSSVLVLLFLKMIVYVDVMFPLVLYISILMVMSRWIRDNELVVINACGIGLDYFMRPAIILFVVVGSMVAAFSLYLSPLSASVAESVQVENRQQSGVTGIIPGVFTEINGGQGAYFIDRYHGDTDSFEGVFLYEKKQNEDNILVSQSAYKEIKQETNDEFFVLKNGSRHSNEPGATFYTSTDFEAYGILLRPSVTQVGFLPTNAQSTWSLVNSGDALAKGEINWRISKIVMLPILMIFAFSFSSTGYRKSRFPVMAVALLVYFTYSNLIGVVVALIKGGSPLAVVYLWLMHLFFLVVAVYLFLRRKENRRLFPSFF